jgi:hypothetical protein
MTGAMRACGITGGALGVVLGLVLGAAGCGGSSGGAHDGAAADATDAPADVAQADAFWWPATDTGPAPADDATAADARELSDAPSKNVCTSTGGTVSTAACCFGTADYPNTCSIGPCGCAPEDSTQVTVCSCPAQKCFMPGVGCRQL